MGEQKRRRLVAVTNINLGRGAAGREMQLAAEDQGSCVRGDLTKYAQVIAGVIFE